jgi:hypothetical protein
VNYSVEIDPQVLALLLAAGLPKTLRDALVASPGAPVVQVIEDIYNKAIKGTEASKDEPEESPILNQPAYEFGGIGRPTSDEGQLTARQRE